MEGFKGKKNVYLCGDCGHGFVSKDLDEGVTPFMTTCLNCGSTARSMMYNIPQELLGAAAVRWVRPPESEWPKFSPSTQEHLKRGGLIRSDHKALFRGKKKRLFRK